MMHVVFDHSAFIPWSQKPKEEKEAIIGLGELILNLDIIWYISNQYLKVLHSRLHPNNYCNQNQFPKFQRILKSKIDLLLKKTTSRKNWCKVSEFIENVKIHIICRNAKKYLLEKLKNSSFMESLAKVKQEDQEVLALAILASRRASSDVYLVTTDRVLLDAASDLEITNLKPLTPKKFKNFINNI